MIEGIIFDFDGTLFDTMYIWENLGIEYLISLGKKPRPDFQSKIASMSLFQSACYCQKEYGISLSVPEIIQGLHNRIKEIYYRKVCPKPGVENFLRQLKDRKIRMCIATATERDLIEAALIRCHMREFFTEIFTCSEVGHGKDEPEIFRRALCHLETDRAHGLVFEDAYHAIRTAKEDGFQVAGIYDAYEPKKEQVKQLVDLYLEDFSDTETFWKFASAC